MIAYLKALFSSLNYLNFILKKINVPQQRSRAQAVRAMGFSLNNRLNALIRFFFYCVNVLII